MLLCLDVHYDPSAATAAAVGFSSWSDATSTLELVVHSESAPAPYQPGSFYEREMPYLTSAVLRVERHHALTTIVIDGHVWLSAGRPGLGAHLHEALGARIAIVGVAKSAFQDGIAIPVLRGESRQPLYVTAIGTDPSRAAELVRDMHGAHRIPTLFKRADQLARGHEHPAPSKTLPDDDDPR